MPYYLFNIQPAPPPVHKHLTLLDEFEKFQLSKKIIRQLRDENTDPKAEFKIVFADNVLEAEEKLMETRDAPFLAEWER